MLDSTSEHKVCNSFPPSMTRRGRPWAAEHNTLTKVFWSWTYSSLVAVWMLPFTSLWTCGERARGGRGERWSPSDPSQPVSAADRRTFARRLTAVSHPADKYEVNMKPGSTSKGGDSFLRLKNVSDRSCKFDDRTYIDRQVTVCETA